MDGPRSKYDPRKDPIIREIRILTIAAITVNIASISVATAIIALLR